MSPRIYIQARESGVSSCIIDDKPYLPQLKVNVSNQASIVSAAAAMLDLGLESTPHVERIPLGLTNLLFRVSSETCTCLVRIFGAEGMIDRDIENSLFAALSRQGIATTYYGRFANGRVEGWLNMRPLAIHELPLYAKPIAISLGTMHAAFEPPHWHSQDKTLCQPALWSQLQRWMKQALLATFSHTNDEAHKVATLQLEDLPAQLHWLQHDVVPSNASTAFCHNDLLAANIMRSNHDDHDSNFIQLIDFEYGSMNFVAYDIANHFNEYAGGTDNGVPQYDLLPTEDQQKEFIAEYVSKRPTPGDLYSEVQAFLLVNHLYWGLWAVNQAATEGCDQFDYLLYAQNRLKQYRKSKNQMTACSITIKNN